MKQQQTGNLLNTTMNLLSDSRIEEIWSDTLSNNDEYVSCFKGIDDRLNKLLPITPKDARNSLYEIERSVNEIVSTSNDKTYRRGFQDGISLLLELMRKQRATSQRPRYILLECESRRKDAYRPYGGKTGWVYKLARVLKEYVNEAEADQDMARLRIGEITESELIRKRTHGAAKLI